MLFRNAVSQRAPTGTLVRAEGTIIELKNHEDRAIYESVASFVRLSPHARAIPSGKVEFYGILEWREGTPLLRVHYVVPLESKPVAMPVRVKVWRTAHTAVRRLHDAVHHLIVRSITRGRILSLP
jgi:hypothetical protein